MQSTRLGASLARLGTEDTSMASVARRPTSDQPGRAETRPVPSGSHSQHEGPHDQRRSC